MKRQWLLPIVCAFTLFLFAGTALASPQKSTPIPLRDDLSYDAFVHEMSDLLARKELHTTLSIPEYNADISEDGFTAYHAATPSTVQVAFYVKDDRVYRVVTLYRPTEQQMNAEATAVLTAICAVNGLTLDEVKQLFHRKTVKENLQVGSVYCTNTQKHIYTMTNWMDDHVFAVGIFALDN